MATELSVPRRHRSLIFDLSRASVVVGPFAIACPLPLLMVAFSFHDRFPLFILLTYSKLVLVIIGGTLMLTQIHFGLASPGRAQEEKVWQALGISRLEVLFGDYLVVALFALLSSIAWAGVALFLALAKSEAGITAAFGILPAGIAISFVMVANIGFFALAISKVVRDRTVGFVVSFFFLILPLLMLQASLEVTPFSTESFVFPHSVYLSGDALNMAQSADYSWVAIIGLIYMAFPAATWYASWRFLQ